MAAPNQASVLSDPLRRFLEAPRYATIATVQPDGSPHQAVVWYALEPEGTIMINSRRGRRWPANLERDPRIALAVYDDANPEHWVAVRGTVVVVRSGESAVADIQALARRYEGNPGEYAGQDRITFRITPITAFDYGD